MLFTPLLVGIGVGVLLVVAAGQVLASREVDPTWRGYLNAVGAGIALSALIDLLPIWLEMLSTVLELGFRAALAPYAEVPPAVATVRAIFVELVPLLSVLVVLFLYLKANALPPAAASKREAEQASDMPAGWRKWLAIPAVGESDWAGVALFAVGLAGHNLWLGQMRGALIRPELSGLAVYLPTLSAAGAVRPVAVLGLLLGLAAKWRVMAALAVLLGAAEVLGVLWPAGRSTLALGILPVTVVTFLLPIALGRMLRLIQRDIGLGWRTTAVVLAALLVTRQLDRFMLAFLQSGL